MTEAVLEAGYEDVLRLLGVRTGLSVRPTQRENVQHFVQRQMRRAGIANVGEYRRLLADDASAFDDLVSELTVGETYFFREPRHFRFIRDTILPSIAQRRGSAHVIRVWSAGCASGEEPYSLAILFDRAGLNSRTQLLATDICRRALTRAREGIYHAWSFRGEGDTLARPYLTWDGAAFCLDAQIRSRVRFEYLNLALDVYPSIVTGTWGLDLILCRNVLIYFDEVTVRSVARRLFESLAVGGWLLTSSGDPPLGSLAPFETVSTPTGIYYRRPLPSTPQVPAAVPVPPLADYHGAVILGNAAGPDDATEGAPVAAAAEDSDASALAGPRLPGMLEEARASLAEGEYQRAADLAGDPSDAAACAIHVQALANLDGAAALDACAGAVARHPLSVELCSLYAVLLMEANQHAAAADAGRRLIYLDRSLAIGHYLLGTALRRVGDSSGARRSFRNVRELCARRPADEPVPLTDGEVAGRLAEAAELQLSGLPPED